jgi:hypothetical protein
MDMARYMHTMSGAGRAIHLSQAKHTSLDPVLQALERYKKPQHTPGSGLT